MFVLLYNISMCQQLYSTLWAAGRGLEKIILLVYSQKAENCGLPLIVILLQGCRTIPHEVVIELCKVLSATKNIYFGYFKKANRQDFWESEKMWSEFHKLKSSDEYSRKWREYLSSAGCLHSSVISACNHRII